VVLVPATVSHVGDWVAQDCPTVYLRAFGDCWTALPEADAGWLAQIPVDVIEVYGDFSDQDGEAVRRVRRSGSNLRVTVVRPALTMLSTGDPAALALADVHDSLRQIADRFSIGWTPVLEGLSPNERAAADEIERLRDCLKAAAVEFIRAKSALPGVDAEEAHRQLTDGAYSEALGALMRAYRVAGVALPEASNGEVQRMRVELRTHDL